MKKVAIFVLFVVVLSSFSLSLRADIVVLVHGWAANADSWLHSGVLQVLHRNGWASAGTITSTHAGILHHGEAEQVKAQNKVYRVNLPAQAPLQIQAAHLYSQLAFIREKNAHEKIILVGHSAGGIVSRLVLVNENSPAIDTLITIASPNLGTVRALQGLDVVHDKPFFCPGPGIHFLKDIAGGDNYHYLKHSQGALVDLTPAVAGTLIGWLNQQPHPAINYHSIVRQQGDELVPAFSQDLNQVPQLKGKSRLHLISAGHSLNPADGQLIATIINHK